MKSAEYLLEQFTQYANNQDILTRFHSQEVLSGFSNSELNCIDVIGRHKTPNATLIAEQVVLTRSAVSKIVRRLISKGAAVSFQSKDNQKEIYYKLTPYGKEVFKQHRARHDSWKHRDMAFFSSLPEEDLQSVIRFMEQYNAHLENAVAEIAEEASNGTIQ